MRVLIADDQRLFAQALRAALLEYDIDVVGIAADGAEAVRLVHDLAPDVVILDVEMPRATGFEVMETLRAEGTRTRVAVLTGGGSPDDRRRAAELGATAFLSKSQTLDEIVEAVRLVGALSGIANNAAISNN
jgi:two-component system, NarL family, response regulator DesR